MRTLFATPPVRAADDREASRDDPAPEVIAVDLDGTLLLTDTLHESVVLMLRDHPLQLLRVPLWLSQGKAAMKERIAERVVPNAASLPYNEPLVAWLRERRAQGATLVLCTATDIRVARAVADHLKLFDEVIASDGSTNVAGRAKRAALERRFGEKGFDYAGNSQADVDVWSGARRAIAVNAPGPVLRRAHEVAEVSATFPAPRVPLSQWARVLRVHQYLKNLLLFVPLVAAHQLGDLGALSMLLVAFLSFSLCASSVYITNDLLDLESDRLHPRKRRRPFASGAVPITAGVVLAPLCAAASLALAWTVGPAFVGWLLVYFALTFAYSLRLKRVPLVDCLTLAALYTLRIVAGAATVAVPLSFWLLAFSIFLFLSLAFVKRYAELRVQAAHGSRKAHGRGYDVDDAPLVQTMGIASGYASVLVLAMYLQSETVVRLYHAPEFIWASVPVVLFWISWVWLKAHRGQMHDDPIVFAVRDRTSLAAGALFAATFVLAKTWSLLS